MSRLVAALVPAALLAVAAPSARAAAPVSFTRIAGVASPGTPSKDDRVGILRIGPPTARNILVLNPGTSAGSGYFEPLAQDVVAKAKGWQVWSVERRENLLEDQSMFDKGKAGTATPTQVFDFYLGYLADPSISPHYQPVPDAQVGFARQWGMRTEIGDLRRVVDRARTVAGRRGHVVLGGHSLGGTITTAYATWDFAGTPGAAGLSGLVLIDGASRTQATTAAAARQSLQQLAASSPWLTVGGFPAPLAGLFEVTGALGVLKDPDGPSVGQQFPLLPADLKPPIPATNAGQYGYALDTKTSPASLALAQGHLGHLAPDGGWVSDEITPLTRFADMFAGGSLHGIDGVAWYHPERLSIDAGAVGNGLANPAQKVLDVDSTDGRKLPRALRIYAFAASLGGTRVLDAARALARQSHIPAGQVTTVDRHTTYAHNDPNAASPKNDFVAGLVPFLKKVAR